MPAPLESLAANETPPSPNLAPAELLQYLMEEHNLRQADLVPIFGSKSYVSQVLSGHRPISRATAAKLAAHFRVAPHTFL